MRTRDRPYETFRRSWLTLAPEWSLALGISLPIMWFYRRSDLQGPWGALSLVSLPMVWATYRTLQWAGHTWTATADGRLILEDGVLFRRRRVVHLCSARRVESRSPIVARWLSIGHVTFRANDSRGRLRAFQWTWVERHARLCEILRARGQLPVGGPSRWQIIGSRVSTVARRMVAQLAQGWALETLARLQGRWFVDDYGRFLAFCNRLLRNRGREQWAPSWAPPAVVKRWMMVLRRHRIIVDAPTQAGWRIGDSIHSVEDIRHHVSKEDLRRLSTTAH